MKLDLQKKEAETLIELLYLGNWLANAAKHEDKVTRKFEDFFSNIVQQVSSENQRFNEEKTYTKLMPVIAGYEKAIFVSQFAQQYADYKYPLDLDAEGAKIVNSGSVLQYVKNSVVKQLCEKEINANSFKNVIVHLPNLPEAIQKKMDSLTID